MLNGRLSSTKDYRKTQKKGKQKQKTSIAAIICGGPIHPLVRNFVQKGILKGGTKNPRNPLRPNR